MNVIFPMYFGEKRGCSSAGSSSSSRKLKKIFSCYTYALEWGQQQCPCKFQLLVFLNTPIIQPLSCKPLSNIFGQLSQRNNQPSLVTCIITETLSSWYLFFSFEPKRLEVANDLRHWFHYSLVWFHYRCRPRIR